MAAHGLGYIPDEKDSRDLSVESDLDDYLGADVPPPANDKMLSHFCSILDQDGAEGCVGFSGAGAIRAWWSYHGLPSRLPSALWLWQIARKTHGAELLNVGTYIRAMLKAAFNLGFCSEEVFPSNYPARDFAKEPSHEVFRSAFDQRSFGYYRVTGLYDERKLSLMRTINSGCPFIFGTGLSNEFFIHDHRTPLDPPKASDIIGGHAMYALAYDEDGVRGPNSHGADFGVNGFFYLSWEYMLWLMTRDIWAISHPFQFSE